jgi:prepilin-type N-terminal cleavage/methylation domain-containing protein
MKNKNHAGFTLIELMVVITIIALLSSILYASFNDARMMSRDKTRTTSLKELQLSIEFYKSQNGRYPASGCTPVTSFAGPGPVTGPGLVTCTDYIKGITGALFVPDFISSLPKDPKFEADADKGFYYKTDTDGTAYKLMILDSVESAVVTSTGDEFARCPGSTCGGSLTNTYAVYSVGAETW